MRGPGVRLNYDVRRLWKCPLCGYERHAPATEVGVRCHCSKDEPRMKLVEGVRRNRPLPQPMDLYVELEELPADESETVPEAVCPIPESQVSEPPQPDPGSFADGLGLEDTIEIERKSLED